MPLSKGIFYKFEKEKKNLFDLIFAYTAIDDCKGLCCGLESATSYHDEDRKLENYK